MTERIAAWSLLLVFAAQLMNLWPLPSDVAAKRIAFWSDMKNHWERTDPAKSENPAWTATAKAESLSKINEVLSDTGAVVYEARVEWTLWLCSALLAGGAAVAGLRRSIYWRWLSLASLALFMWLQQPWHVFRFFILEGQLEWSRGMHQVELIARDFPGTFLTMMLFNVALPILLLTVATYALYLFARSKPNAL